MPGSIDPTSSATPTACAALIVTTVSASAGDSFIARQAMVITSGSDELTLMAGVDTQVFHGFVNCGAKGAITGVGNALPKEVLRFLELCRAAATGDPQARRWALELSGALEVLSIFDEGPDLVLYYKELMVLEGHDAYRHQLYASDQLSASQIRQCLRTGQACNDTLAPAVLNYIRERQLYQT